MARALVFGLALLIVISTFGQPTTAQELARKPGPTRNASGQAGADLSPSQIFSRARHSVVIIVASDQNGQREALGSGFIVSHGKIATNYHVVEGMSEAYVVFSDGDVKPASKIIADSPQQDLIILAVETGNRSPLVFGDELSLQQGDSVYALGAPKGLELSFTNGIVSSFRKSEAQFLIQTTAPIAPGSSGGPLFDRTGRVVGVTTSLISDAPGIYFSVGIRDLERLLRTPQGVAFPFGEWAKQWGNGNPSESGSGTAEGQSHKGQSGAPTLQDTISWMESFSTVHGMARNGESKVIHTNIVNPPTSDTPVEQVDCTVSITHSGPNFRQTDFVRLNMVDPEGIAVRKDNWGYKAEFGTSDSSYSIPEVFEISGEASKHRFVAVVEVYFDSEENAKRFATAFKHAASLCGGAKSLF